MTKQEYTWDEIKTIFTCGGCGILAQEILDIFPAGKPVLWYDEDNAATHAAVMFSGSRLIHYGDREHGYKTVDRAELDRAVKEDFDPRGDEDEIRELAKKLTASLVTELT